MRSFCLAALVLALSGCASTAQNLASTPAPAPAPTAQQTPAPAQAKARQVEGLGGWKGEIKGNAVANSPFNKLKIGMGPKEVHDLIGPPADQGRHITGKAWIPFYYGSGSLESIQHYKGVGRLIFANSSRFSSSMGLIQIDHDGAERGYR